MPAAASAEVICDSGGGTEVGFEETLQGNSDTLGGIYDLRTSDFGGRIFAGTLVVEGGGSAPLDITTQGGLVRLEFGDIEIAEGACVVADRLVIDRARVTVGSGALLGGNSGFAATSTFPDGGLGGTEVNGSTVNFTPGSEVLFGSRWNLLGTSTLSLDLENEGNSDSAVFSSLSGGPSSTLEVAAGTTMTVSRFSGDAGAFEGTLAGEGTIVVRFGFGGTATWTARPSDSTFSGSVVVDDYMTLVAEDLGPASLTIGPRGRAFVSGVLGSLVVSDLIGATDPSENVSTLGARLGINEDGTPGRLDVTGDMIMSPLTVLTMNLGAPKGVPGVDSDLITVGGDLTLDGVLLVTDAGGFGFGLYRLFNYGGALNDGSLELVGVPTGFSVLDFNVSTATAGQVNLLVGDQGGGEEPPEIAIFPDDVDTLLPGDYDPSTMVIFQGDGRSIALPGEVPLGSGGLQFAGDDFALVPGGVGGRIIFLEDPLGLGFDTPIRVGDGTAAGAEFTATIGVNLTGPGGFTKTDLGTLVLTGNNDYTGGTRITNGTLEVHDTASLPGDIEILEPGTLLLELTGIDQTLSGKLTGGGTIVKSGTGSLTAPLVGESTYAGTINVNQGNLNLQFLEANALASFGVLLIDEDAFAAIFGGGTAAAGEVVIEGGGGLTVGPDTTVQVGTVKTAPGSVITLEDESILDVIDGFLSGELATPDGLFRVRGLVTLAGDTSDFHGAIDILSGGTLTFDQAEDGAFGGTVSGEGHTVKSGDGLLEFFAFDPAYVGGITVAAGTLQVNADSVHGAIDILPGGTLRFHQTQNGTFTGSVSGGGLTVKTGDGILDFFGFDPAYSGGLSVLAGSFRGEAEGMPDTIDILSSGTVVFNQSSDASYSGTATGTGTIAKEGDGTLTLEVGSGWSRVFTLDAREGETRVLVTEADGSARFETVTIASGAGLTLAPGTTVGAETLTGAGSSKVTLADGSVLVLEAGDSILDEIAGDGLLDIRGQVTLAGDSPNFSGDMEVAVSGELTLNGSAGGPPSGEEPDLIRALIQGALRGVGGSSGDFVILSGGLASPGNSIGTLTIGSITFAAGSIFEVEVNDAGQSDLLAVTGAATLNGGIVNVLAENRTDDGSTYGIETQYTILTAGGGVTGTFDEVNEDFAFLAASLSYSANAVTLTLARDGLVNFCLGGATANQCATGEGVESLGSGALYNAVLILSEAEAPTAFDALSGEVHASLRIALLEDSRFPREAAVARLRAAFDAVGGAADMPGRRVSDRFSLWGQGFGAWGDWDGGGNAARLDRSVSGLTMGGDVLIGEALRIGLFGGYSHASFDLNQRASSGSINGFHVGVYGGGQWGGFGLRAGAAHSWQEVETNRSVAFSGFADDLAADYDARTLQAFAEAGYRLELGAAAVEPFAGVAHVSVHTDGFGETGAAAALTAAERTVDTTFTTLGLRAQSGLGGSSVRLSGMGGWRHAFGDVEPVTLAFAGGDAFAVAGAPLAADSALLEIGLDVTLAPGATIGLGYAGQFGSGFSDHGANAHVSIRF